MIKNRDIAAALRIATNQVINENKPYDETKGRYFQVGNIAIKIGEIENITPSGWSEN